MACRVLFDINILLDVLTRREPFHIMATELWARAERREIEGVISAASIPTIYYLLTHLADQDKAMVGVRAVRDIFEIIALDQTLVDQAIDHPASDLEDAIQACAAIRAKADYIVTRDAKGFRKSHVPAISPEALLANLDR
jgi:predicted nucleic acid-binding protein